MIHIDLEKCTLCDLCVLDCPVLVIERKDDTVKATNQDWCINCGHCVAICPVDAVRHDGLDQEQLIPVNRDLKMEPEPLMHLLRERRSVRQYKEKPVREDLIAQVIEAGRYAPTGINAQNVRWIVITDHELLRRLNELTINYYKRLFTTLSKPVGEMVIRLVAGAKLTDKLKDYLPMLEKFKGKIESGVDRLFYDAPVLIVVHAPSWDTNSHFNCSVALYNASLQAHTLGLGCCFNGFFEGAVNHSSKIKRILDIPKENRVYAAMTMGWQKAKYYKLVSREPAKISWNPGS